jgi:hypothetical protein
VKLCILSLFTEFVGKFSVERCNRANRPILLEIFSSTSCYFRETEMNISFNVGKVKISVNSKGGVRAGYRVGKTYLSTQVIKPTTRRGNGTPSQ